MLETNMSEICCEYMCQESVYEVRYYYNPYLDR